MADSITYQAGQAVDVAKNKAGKAVSNSQGAFGAISAEARKVIKGQATKQKNVLADEIANIAKAFRIANDTLHRSSSLDSGEYGEVAIGKLDDFAAAIRGKDIDEIAADTSKFAQANPVVFIWAALGLGFVVARFLKSKSAAA